MLKIIKAIWLDIRNARNLDVYITIAITFPIIVLSILGITTSNVIASSILAVLILISLGTLENRRQNFEIRSNLEKLRNRKSQVSDFLTNSYGVDHVKQHIGTAQNAFFWGITLAGPIRSMYYQIGDRLQDNLKIRFLLIKPSDESLKRASLRSSFRNSQQVRHDLTSTLSTLAKLQSETSNFAKLEVKVIDYVPPWTFIQIDSFISIAFLPFRVAFERRPSFELRAEIDKEWFNFFSDQSEAAWEVAEEINLAEYLNP